MTVVQETQPPRLCLPGRKLLVLQNPGRGSRNFLNGIIAGLGKLGVGHCVLELQEIWDTNKTDTAGLVQRLSRILVEQRIGAVLSYGFNGMTDVPLDRGPMEGLRSFFEIRGIPHMMLWIDHPQWHADLVGLSPALQGLFRSANCLHFLKSTAAATELERIVGWPNCFALAPGVEPAQFPVCAPPGAMAAKKEFDVVTICSEKGDLAEWLKEFVALDNPDPAAIRRVILDRVYAALDQLWQQDVPQAMRPEVSALGRTWAALKAGQPFLAAIRHWPALVEEFPGAAWYLTLEYPIYMKAVRILWRLREWERLFYLAYLAKYFRVGVFGGDLSPMGLGPGGGVDYTQQSAIYARGHVALTIPDGHDEEGLTLKAFELAASGVAMLHYRAETLGDYFVEGREVAVFSTPREAREKVDALLDNADRRQAMATAAHQRVLRDHRWENRIEQMFQRARLPLSAFCEPANAAARLSPPLTTPPTASR